VLDELGRHGVGVRFTDAPPLDDDPQAKLLTQVQGVIAEYERAKIAERYRRGKLFRSRAREVLAWRTPYSYRRQPRDADGPARLVVFEPEAAVVRRIFHDAAVGGHSLREIIRRLAADGIPPPAGRDRLWSTSTLSELLRNEAYIGRVYFNRPSPTRAPDGAASKSHAPARNGSPSRCPLSSRSRPSRPPAAPATTTASGAHAAPNPANGCARPGQCGVCGVGTNCHKMRGRNGTWHRYYYCRNHDPIKAGGADRRCTERNIRSDALDDFAFNQVRAALLLLRRAHRRRAGPRRAHPHPRRRAARRRTGPPGPPARRHRRRTPPPHRPLVLLQAREERDVSSMARRECATASPRSEHIRPGRRCRPQVDSRVHAYMP
jgi:site-specific DNA recombinase